ncbi:MAG: hypothetical protein GX567_19135 [Clostridia bacterium]|nr:hypothetical protein [Clostridia bacterium]
MKRTSSIVLLFLFCFIFAGCEKESTSEEKRVEDAQLTYTEVQVVEEVSDTVESSYRIGATLPGTDFSSLGNTVEDKLTQEWSTFDSMSKEAKLLSSQVWGIVSFEADTWNECEEAIGVTVNNPLESLNWLNKTGHIGMESADPNTPIKHIEATVNAANIERKVSEISVTAGYNTQNARITLTTNLTANTKTYTIGSVYNGYATYKQNTVTTKSGIHVLVVTTSGSNNNSYYNDEYYDLTAYWVKDNAFYTLHVFGNATDKADIQADLDRILAEI